MISKLEELTLLRNVLIKIGQIAPDIKDQIKKTIDIITQLEFYIRQYECDHKSYFDFKNMPRYYPVITKKESIFLMNQHSYLTKNKFMELINNLDFIAIENTRIHFITDFVNQIKINDPKDSRKDEYITKTRGFDLELY